MSKLSSFLKRERDARGWSMSDLAEKSGVPLSSLSRYESPRYRGRPSHANVLLIASVFNMDPQQVLKFIGYPVRGSVNNHERDTRWHRARELLEEDPRAERILELYESATDEERDTGLTLLEAYFSRPRRRKGRSGSP